MVTLTGRACHSFITGSGWWVKKKLIKNIPNMATQPQKMDRVAFWFLMAMLIIGLLIITGLAITPVIMHLTGH